MSKLFRRKGFRLASVAYFLSLGTLALALFAWFSTSSTFSWFASNKQVDATGMAIKVKADEDVDIEMKAYKYVYDSEKGYIVSETEDLAMSRYDQIFQENNVYTPILLKLTLTGGVYANGEDLPMRILRGFDDGTSLETADKTIWKYDSNGDLASSTMGEDSTYSLSSYISSVITVKAFVANDTTTITWNDGDLTASFEAARENIFESTSSTPNYTEKRFVTSLKNAEGTTSTTKVSSLDFTNELDYYAGADGVCNVYVWLDYDDSSSLYSKSGYSGLINAYIEQMKSDSTSINITYPLLCDINQLTIIKDSTSSS